MAQSRKIVTPVTVVYYRSRFIRERLGYRISSIFKIFREYHNLQYRLCHIKGYCGKYIIDDGVCDFELYLGKKLKQTFSAHVVKDYIQILEIIGKFVDENQKEILRLYNNNLKVCEYFEEIHDYRSLYLFYEDFDRKKEYYYRKKMNKKLGDDSAESDEFDD